MKSIFLLLALVSTSARADLPEPGEKLFVHTSGGVSLYKDTPDSFGNRASKSGQRIEECDAVVIVEEPRQLMSAMGGELWIHIADANNQAKQGWIRAGSQEDINANGFALSHKACGESDSEDSN